LLKNYLAGAQENPTARDVLRAGAPITRR